MASNVGVVGRYHLMKAIPSFSNLGTEGTDLPGALVYTCIMLQLLPSCACGVQEQSVAALDSLFHEPKLKGFSRFRKKIRDEFYSQHFCPQGCGRECWKMALETPCMWSTSNCQCDRGQPPAALVLYSVTPDKMIPEVGIILRC